MVRLTLKFNNTLLKEIESSKEEITIGRNEDNDIQVDNMAVSGAHARIVKGPGHYFIEDLNSTNGTFVNEEKVTKRALRENDAITVGKHTVLLSFNEQGGGGKTRKINEIERTYKLETERHKEMLKKQGRKK